LQGNSQVKYHPQLPLGQFTTPLPAGTVMNNNNLTIRTPPGAKRLEDNSQWELRFEVHSGSSSRVYIVARNKATQKWSCSCPGWISNRVCKHLTQGCGIPERQIHGREAFLLKKQERLG